MMSQGIPRNKHQALMIAHAYSKRNDHHTIIKLTMKSVFVVFNFDSNQLETLTSGSEMLLVLLPLIMVVSLTMAMILIEMFTLNM